MTSEERELVGRAWLEQALGEHASVAAFSRFVLHLMNLAAPPELLLGAIKAMEEEVHHARYCFGIASRFIGTPAGPGALDLAGVVGPAATPEAILEGAIIEGCVNETLSARYAELALERTRDSGIHRVLKRIVEEESRHADLSWRFLEWMLAKHPALAPVAEASFTRALSARPAAVTEDAPAVLEEYGHLLPSAKAKARQVMIREVILPRARAMLGGQALPALARPSQGMP